MAGADPLPPAALRRRTDPDALGFGTSAELAELEDVPGQARAVEAVRFGLGIRRYGFNLFALGPSGMGKHGFVRQFLERAAAGEPVPPDWCYVHNFADPQRPRALRLPAGRGGAFKQDVRRLVEELHAAIPAAFESEDYRNRRKLLETRFNEESERPFAELDRCARERGIAVIRTPVGVALAPTREGEVMDPDEFRHLPEPDQERLRSQMTELQKALQDAVASLPQDARRHRRAIKELERETTAFAVGPPFEELRARYAELPELLAFLEALRQDVLENADEFQVPAEAGDLLQAALRKRGDGRSLRRYEVNLLVDNRGLEGAPVLYEDHPTLANLVGRIEHLAEMGNLVADFRLIRAGGLHRANGGYLIVDARKLLMQPQAYEELKRALRSRQIRFESLGQALGLVTTASIEPEPIPLDAKVVLVGERFIYYLLATHDPEFLELFKVAADFEESVERTPETERLYGRFLGTLARSEGLRPLDSGAAARVVEHGARLCGDAERLSVHRENLADLLREADHLAGVRGAAAMAAEDVQQAVAAQIRRADRVRERMLDEIRRGTVLIDTAGAKVGQLNGLSYLQLGGFGFGRPARITARARVGTGQVVDIEREVELGGPIHSKGVLILAGFLGARYSAERPLSLQASLVFEQSYAGVEGDSASCAELLALLSALAEVPLAQCLAVTGSVNQLGQVQAVGGVSEKIEGFFDVCRANGLSGAEGVVIPAANVKHLMLRDDVVEAAAAGRFRVFAVENVDEALSLLTGLPAGARDAQGRFPAGSVNQKVEARLALFAEKARAHQRGAARAEGGGSG